MATTSENGSNLADRLMRRSERASRIGSRTSLFERFGLENPYEGGAIGEATDHAEMFSYLSSKAYFDELRGLSAMRRHLIWRISAVRSRLRVGEGIRTAIATAAVRSAMLGAWDPTFVDWSTQLDLEEAGVGEFDSVAVAASRRLRAPERRQTAAERALRKEIASASDVLANLESVASTVPGAKQAELGEEVRRVAGLPSRRQPTAARRITRKLEGAARIAARATGLGRGTELGERPLAVAAARDSFFAPKGLRRVMEDSPIVMTLEQPEAVAPEVEQAPAIQRATRRPVIRTRAHREVPVAEVAREARTQAATGRAGPPVTERPHRRVRPETLSRPTERIARAMRLEEAMPLTDTRRGLRASLREPTEVDSPAHAIERRIAARSEAGLPDESGRLTHTTGYVRESRPVPLGLDEAGKVTRTMALAGVAPEMASIEAGAATPVDASAPTETPARPTPSVRTSEPQRMRTHRTPTSQTGTSRTFRTPSGQTRTSAAVRTEYGGVTFSDAVRTPSARRSPARGARRRVERALPPVARAVHRSVEAPMSDSRVAIARPPVESTAAIDRRSVGLSRGLAAAVALEAAEKRADAGRPSVGAGSTTAARLERRAVAPERDLGDPPGLTGGASMRAAGEAREGLELRAPREGVAPEMRVALPESVTSAAETAQTASAQRALASTGPSRRSRALPTVRAASRALAQERLGARGRLLSPSSTAHLHVEEPTQALTARLVQTGVSGPQPSRAVLDAAEARLPELEATSDTPEAARPRGSAARSERGASRVAARADASSRSVDTAMARGAGSVPARSVDAAAARGARSSTAQGAAARLVVHTDGARSAERLVVSREETPTRRALPAVEALTTLASVAPGASEVHAGAAAPRVGPVARASTRESRSTRVGPTGEMVSPRAVAPFHDEPSAAQTLSERASARAESARDAAADDAPRTLASRVAERIAPVAGTSAEGRPDVSERAAERSRAPRLDAPTELTLARPEAAADDAEVPSGLVSRATRRAPVRAVDRSVVPDPTPETARAHDRRAAAATGATQPVRTESGRVVPSDAFRTAVAPTERSLAWRTPRSFIARTVATRTPDSETVLSEAVRTATRPVELSRAFRTESVQGASRLAAQAPMAAFVDPTPGLEEFDPEGGVVRATRRLAATRASVSESAMSWVDRREPTATAASGSSAARPTQHAIGRSSVRRDAGSVVPHPVGNDAVAVATTRMLAGPDQVYAAPEDVILSQGEAIPGSTLRAAASDERATSSVSERVSERAVRAPAERLDRSVSSRTASVLGLADGMTLATPAPLTPTLATSIAGGTRAVSPRPGAPSRSRLQRALRQAAAVSATTRATDTVLTLPAPQRQLQQAGGSTAPRNLTARLRVDDEGRVLGGSVEDVLSGAVLALPERAAPAEWAEEREARSTRPERRVRPTRRSERDAGGTYVPAMRALEVDALEAETVRRPAASPLYASLDSTLDSLVGGGTEPQADGVQRRPLMRRRAWQRRGMAAELGLLAPSLADAEFSPVAEVPEDAPSWARRAVKGTSSTRGGAEAPEATLAAGGDAPRGAEPVWAPNTLMGALARTESPEDLVQVIIERGREASSIRGELPSEAVRIVETISSLDPAEVAILTSGTRVLQPAALGAAMSGRNRTTRARKNTPDLHQLTAGKDGVGANKVMKLADKLMNLIHLAENARGNEAREQVRMAQDSNEARAEGGIQVPGMSVEDMEMNVESLQKDVLNSVMEYFEELDSRREDPDGRNKWW